MAYKYLEFQIESQYRLMMHNALRLTNPLHPLTKEIKRFTSKKSKTDEDIHAIAKLEWLGGLYTTEEPRVTVTGHNVEISGGGALTIPSEVLEAAIINGAKKNKLGTQFRSGILIDQDSLLEYDGPSVISELYEDKRFVDMSLERVQRNAVIRCRAVFRTWSLKFVVGYLPQVVNKNQLEEAVDVAGTLVGLCERRPKNGRFSVVSCKAA